ncbi:uncharacterized protein RSE6_12018 [Rhynchosporium secalis]|uniref:Uncharacterized protein n=1 Tax=Rhynchosporium secalis TaxID=38038 RepID=A0A1E1MPD4_RHYSE|nr:uncharacterized protein RSE6_12018 [Rhynchosporium secalis]
MADMIIIWTLPETKSNMQGLIKLYMIDRTAMTGHRSLLSGHTTAKVLKRANINKWSLVLSPALARSE